MRKFLLAILILGILVLDFAALDDITTGNEPDLFLEYLILGASVLIFTVVFFKIRHLKN